MKTFEVEYKGKRYEVQANSLEEATAAFGTADPQEDQMYQKEAPATPPEPSYTDRVAQMSEPRKWLEATKGVADTGTSLISGAVAEPIAGVAGAIGAALPGSEGQGERWLNATRDFITKGAWSDAGKYNAEQIGKVAEKVAPALQFVDDTINRITGGNGEETGNVAAATALKTALYGGLSLLGVKGGKINMPMKDIIKAQRTQNAIISEARAQAEKAGIVLNNDDMKWSTRAAADRLAPDREKAANMDTVVNPMIEAEQAARAKVEDAFDAARAKKAYISVPAFKDLPDQALQFYSRVKGYDLPKMPNLMARIEDIRNLDSKLPSVVGDAGRPPTFTAKPSLKPETTTRGPLGEPITVPTATVETAGPLSKQAKFSKVRLNEIEIIRKRISNDIQGDGTKLRPYTAQDKALIDLRRRLDRTMDNEFDAAAISGDPTAIAAWRDAKALHARYRADFKSINVIKKMIAKDASSEELYRWIIGASAMGAKKESAQVIRKMTEILGPDHPAIKTLKMATLRDAFAPIFLENPQWEQGVKNVDRLMLENHTMLDALGIDKGELKAVRNGMRLASEASDPLKWDWSLFTAFLTREAIGNKLAKSAANLRITNKAVNHVLRFGKLSQREISRILLETDTKRPILDPEVAGSAGLKRQILSSGARVDVLTGANPEEE